MLGRLFRKRENPDEPTGAIPEGQRIYAIGDIHGRLDLLDALLLQIKGDAAQRPGSRPLLIFLGDLIDRGPASAQVIDKAMALAGDSSVEARFLLGNHEEVFLTALAGDERALRLFTKIGGRETILSYGLDEARYNEMDFDALLAVLPTLVPQAHIDFLTRFEDMIVVGDYAFVHAGIDPSEPLARQQTASLRWIRNEFLDHRGTLEKIIVHGHTISPDVELRRHRIGLDTGAYASGKLTAMGFETDLRWLLQTSI